jgi:hypothetical protein
MEVVDFCMHTQWHDYARLPWFLFQAIMCERGRGGDTLFTTAQLLRLVVVSHVCPPHIEGRYMHHSIIRLVRTSASALAPIVAALAFVSNAVAAQTVISTAHYQEGLQFSDCSGSTSSCIGDFPAPGSNRRVHLTRMTCHLTAPQGAIYANAYIALLSAGGQAVVFEFLPLDYSATSSGYTQFLLNRPIDLQASGNQHIRATFTFSGGNPIFGLCKVSGTIDKLQ